MVSFSKVEVALLNQPHVRRSTYALSWAFLQGSSLSSVVTQKKCRTSGWILTSWGHQLLWQWFWILFLLKHLSICFLRLFRRVFEYKIRASTNDWSHFLSGKGDVWQELSVLRWQFFSKPGRSGHRFAEVKACVAEIPLAFGIFFPSFNVQPVEYAHFCATYVRVRAACDEF